MWRYTALNNRSECGCRLLLICNRGERMIGNLYSIYKVSWSIGAEAEKRTRVCSGSKLESMII